MKVKLLSITETPDSIIEYAGRVCYNSVRNMHKNPSYILARMREGHESISEHAFAVFEVVNVSRSCLQQVARHGLMSLSVESQRYVNQKEHSYIIPDTIVQKGEELAILFEKHIREAWKIYDLFIEAGVPKEDARYILPECNETKFIISGNFRMFRNFIKQRSHKSAQWEVRALSDMFLTELYSAAPGTFRDLMLDLNKHDTPAS